MENLLEIGEKYNCLIAAAHPFGQAWKNLYKKLDKMRNQENILKKIDLIEVLCGEQLKKNNINAIWWNEEIRKGYVGGSDGHFISELGNVLTCSHYQSLEGYLESLRKRKNFVIGKGIRTTTRFISHSNTFRKHTRYMPRRLKVRIQNTYANGIRPRIKKGFIRIKNRMKIRRRN